MTAYAWGWIAWGLFFAVLEGRALYESGKAVARGEDDPRDTLSEHLWWVFAVNRGGRGIERRTGAGTYLRRTLLVAALGWLVLHLVGGGGLV